MIEVILLVALAVLGLFAVAGCMAAVYISVSVITDIGKRLFG